MSDGARRAAEWVRREKLESPFARARDRYVARGEPAGRIRIERPTDPERRLFSDLLGRSSRLGPLIFSLGELDLALQRSTFGCSLVDVIEALEDTPIVTRPEQQRARQDQEDAWRRELDEILNRSPRSDLAKSWGCERGLVLLYRRYKLASAAERAMAGTAFAHCLDALAQLPRQPAVRLAVFANELTGDPHAFDQTFLAGQLLTTALIASDANADSDARLTTERRAASFERFGLLTDTVWATVAAFNLTRALTLAGSPDPIVEVAGTRVLNLSLRQLARWRAVEAGCSDVYVVENPSVFETLVDRMEAEGSIGLGYPSLVCTSGYLSQPSYRLLDLLAAGGPVRIWYSGDFDPEGLEIASTVLSRYPGQARAWRLSVADYERAATSGMPAQGERLPGLDRLTAVFPELIPVMRERRRWGYQETLINLLLDDIRTLGR